MARRTAAIAALGVLGLAGSFLYQRMTAGNAYAAVSTTAAATEPPTQSFIPLDWASDLVPDFMESEPLKPLRYFEAIEFDEWWPQMSTELLQKLDEFRHRLDNIVMVSPANGSLGRHDGVGTSQHNVDLWGEVRAVDIMFPGLEKSDLKRAFEVAKQVGFTGIGAYPDWVPFPGMHLDVRAGRMEGHPATWAGLTLSDGSQSTGFSIERAWT